MAYSIIIHVIGSFCLGMIVAVCVVTNDKARQRALIEACVKEQYPDSRWILHDVQCDETYECSHCHATFVYDDYEGCDEWEYCPVCGCYMTNGGKHR